MTKDNDELMPCPMSSKKAHLKKSYNYMGNDLFYVICHKSGIRTKNYQSAREAIKAWNTRPTPTQPSADIETTPDNLYTSEKHVKENDNSLHVGEDIPDEFFQSIRLDFKGDTVLRSLCHILQHLEYRHDDMDTKSVELIGDISTLKAIIKSLSDGYVCNRADLSQPKGDVDMVKALQALIDEIYDYGVDVDANGNPDILMRIVTELTRLRHRSHTTEKDRVMKSLVDALKSVAPDVNGYLSDIVGDALNEHAQFEKLGGE